MKLLCGYVRIRTFLLILEDRNCDEGPASSEEIVLEDEEENRDSVNDVEDDAEEKLDFVAITDLLVTPVQHEDEILQITTYSLPKHRRCAYHTLNIVATEDHRGIKSRSFLKIYESVLAKMQGIWNQQSRSTKASDFIKETLGGLFVLPNERRYVILCYY